MKVLKFNRIWAMPSKNTFSIKPIMELIGRYIKDSKCTIDPFVGNSPFETQCISNDLDPEIQAGCHLDALEFLAHTSTDYNIDLVLYDPPYSSRQVSECYKKLKKTVNMETTQGKFWGDIKKEIGRIVIPGGIVISCGWNSGGIGKALGFQIEEILLVPHGGAHYDTIVTVERKFTFELDIKMNPERGV